MTLGGVGLDCRRLTFCGKSLAVEELEVKCVLVRSC
jgi:hypothetical protein